MGQITLKRLDGTVSVAKGWANAVTPTPIAIKLSEIWMCVSLLIRCIKRGFVHAKAERLVSGSALAGIEHNAFEYYKPIALNRRMLAQPH
jgi:hypothetical protein